MPLSRAASDAGPWTLSPRFEPGRGFHSKERLITMSKIFLKCTDNLFHGRMVRVADVIQYLDQVKKDTPLDEGESQLIDKLKDQFQLLSE